MGADYYINSILRVTLANDEKIDIQLNRKRCYYSDVSTDADYDSDSEGSRARYEEKYKKAHRDELASHCKKEEKVLMKDSLWTITSADAIAKYERAIKKEMKYQDRNTSFTAVVKCQTVSEL